jgi:predicted lipoprotein with Yx(FWY)xxD motif
MKIGNRTVLATQMSTGIGTINFPVYSYSKDTGVHSACSGLCAVNWPPVLTSGTPGVTSGLLEANVGTLHSSTGTQVSYMGKPLYLFGFEAIGKTASGLGATGNGNGISVDGGTFRLVNA